MNAPSDASVQIRQEGPVTIIALHRPQRRHAVDSVTAQLLFDAFENFDRDSTASVAVLTGDGDSFCAGADLKAVAEGDQHTLDPSGGQNTLGPMGPTRMTLSKPVIAAIEGHAVAGGMELALWADLRIVADNAVMGIYCRRFGVPLIDMGTIRLPRLIGQSRAMDLILTGRPVHAEEAFAIGLANRVVPAGQALQAAIKMAQELAAFPQTCMRNDRLSLLAQWSLTTDEAIANEMRGGLQVIAAGETQAGAKAFAKGVGRHGHFDPPSSEPH
jgi:enoyl-CoA hydratase